MFIQNGIWGFVNRVKSANSVTVAGGRRAEIFPTCCQTIPMETKLWSHHSFRQITKVNTKNFIFHFKFEISLKVLISARNFKKKTNNSDINYSFFFLIIHRENSELSTFETKHLDHYINLNYNIKNICDLNTKLKINLFKCN